MPNTITGIHEAEKNKYLYLWTNNYKPSKCAAPLAHYVARNSKPGWSLLDIGCGNGITVNILKERGFDCMGLDITLAGIKDDGRHFVEASVWDMPFPDGFFDFTFSTDLLEHLPQSLVEGSIKEIFRVTRKRTFHSIANFQDVRLGQVLHLTMQPAEWWIRRFEALNAKGLECEIIDRKIFLVNQRGQY